MKVEVKYKKTMDGNISAMMTVIEAIDFPQGSAILSIFSHCDVDKIMEYDMLKDKDHLTQSLSRLFDSSEKAKEWVNIVAEWMKREIGKWRSIKLPENYIVEL